MRNKRPVFLFFCWALMVSFTGLHMKGEMNSAPGRPPEETIPAFGWIMHYTGHDSSQTELSLIVSYRGIRDTVFIGTFYSPLSEQGYPVDYDTEVAGSVVIKVSGWWAGGGDAVMLYKEGDRYHVYWREIAEENGWQDAKNLGEIVLPSSTDKRTSFIKYPK